MKDQMMMNTKDFDFEIKSVEDNGVFVGYGSTFGNVDQGNEIVAKGAFADSLLQMAAKGRKLPILWQHRSGEPIGVYDTVKEDDHGLLMQGRLLVSDVQRAKEAHALMKAGAVSGMSIGYGVLDDHVDTKTRVRTLKKLDLKETSIVTFPMNDEARVAIVKSRLSHDDLPSLPEFEDLLRDAGFSRKQATAIASHGFKHLLNLSDSGEGEKPSDALLKSLQTFDLSKVMQTA
jgi:HK97 family phage prohead protease